MATTAAHMINTELTTTTTKMRVFMPRTEPSSLAATAESTIDINSTPQPHVKCIICTLLLLEQPPVLVTIWRSENT
jgi:hypothetical protein